MFCPKCKSIMMPKKEKNHTVMQCSCGYREIKDGAVKIIDKSNVEEKKLVIIEKPVETLPIAKEKCHKCGNDSAYYELRQTRSADESPTKFLRCTKCGHMWRDYD